MPDLDDDEMTELVDADFNRVDLVGKGANGIPRFLIAKQDEASRGLVPAELVRELIGKQAEPEPEPAAAAEQVTMTGSPAAIAAFIHKAAVRAAEPGDVAKAAESTKSQNDLPDSDFAFIESGGKKDDEGKTTPRSLRHFPINDAAHVRNALARLSSSPFGDKASGKVHSAAKKFGIDVSKEAGVADQTVTKDVLTPDPDDGVDGLDPTVPLAAPDDLDEIPGDPADPGSPAWEAIDAATATKWLSILARAQNAIGLLSDREMVEAATGADPDDMDSACDLQDAQYALDYVIGQLAVFAAGEQAEADLASEAMEQVGKAAAAAAGPIDVIEGLTAVRKAGRVLSSANEGHIREAAQRLNTVLSSLPQAPATTDDGQPVAKSKEAAMTATATEPVAKDAAPSADEQAATGPADALPGDPPGREVMKAAMQVAVYDASGNLAGIVKAAKIVQQVAKADADAGDGAKTTMQAVFDEDGNLVGIVDPADITPVTGAGAKAADDDGADDSADGDDSDAAPAADDSDMTPQPAADAGTPADAVADDGTVAKSSDSDVFQVLESVVAKAVAAALDTKTPAEDVAKQADVAGLLEEVETLKARLATVEEHPAAPKVFTNGQVPPASQLRGQDQGATPVDVAKAAELKQTLYRGTAQEQNKAHREMQEMAIAAFGQLRR